MNDKVEIPSNTFCVMPWIHLHAWPEGKAMLCCKAHGGENGGDVGDFSVNTYQEIMNSDKMKQIRLDMLEGKTVPQCIACTNDEKLDKKSFRQDMNSSYSYLIPELLSSEHTLQDGGIKDPKMYYMDFRFSNLCNLGCQTCGSPLSSTIANNRANNDSETHFLKSKNVLSERGTITSFVYARPDFFEVDVLPYIDDVTNFYFAGGEPLMHQEHFDILKYMNENKLYDKHIAYSTNLSLLKWKGTDFLEIWKNFNNILFFCSIDGDNERLEYIREFSKHKIIFNNMKKLIQLKKDNPLKRFRICICYTHSIYNCYYTKEFFSALINEGVLDDLDHIEFNYAYGERNHPAILPDFAKEELIQKRNADRNSEELNRAFELFPDLRHYFDSIDNILYENMPKNEFDKLINHDLMPKIDKIKTALPWLHSVVERHRVM